MNIITHEVCDTILESLKYSEDRIRNYEYPRGLEGLRIEKTRKLDEAKQAIKILKNTTKD